MRSIYQWHRYIGVSIAVFIIILALTGIMLNHTERLELDKQYIQSNWLLNHYGIIAPQNVISFHVGKHWVSLWADKLFLDDHVIDELSNHLIGAVYYQNMVIIADRNSLFAYTNQGELVERMTGSNGVPEGIEAIGITSNYKLALRTENSIYTSNEEFVIWQKTPVADSVWSGAASLPHILYQKILERYRGKGLKLERVILDLHSGRFLGHGGVFFMDLVAIFMLFLVLSGFWLWSTRIFKRKKHNHKN